MKQKTHDRLNLDIPLNTESNQLATYLQFLALPASIMNLSGAGNCLVVGALLALSSRSDVPTALAHETTTANWCC
jgi:hypothetical protein